MSMKKIRFVDNGQDFLEWIIKDGKVISCKPYQERIWLGVIVAINGDTAHYEFNGNQRAIIHKIAEVTDMESSDV